MTDRIAYTKPSITELEVRYAADAAANGWGTHCYDYIHRFEADFRDHLDVSYAVATSSCTGAMTLGLGALGIGPGDEVILADINWIATAAPVIHAGATPVLVDIEPESWCIDPVAAEASITSRTRAIVATHIYGNLCDLAALRLLCDANDLILIEDAAEAIGSFWQGKRAGSVGRFGTFSFHGTKTVTTGEGGMFVTDEAGLYEKALTLSNHGRSREQTKQFWADEVGYKFKMSNIEAALGCGQMQRIEELIARKRAIFAAYLERLAHLPLTMNPERDGCRNGYWMPTVLLDKALVERRDVILTAMKASGIDARVFFHPLSDQGHFERCHETPVAHDISARAFNLPSYHDMSDKDIDRVADAICSGLAGIK